MSVYPNNSRSHSGKFSNYSEAKILKTAKGAARATIEPQTRPRRAPFCASSSKTLPVSGSHGAFRKLRQDAEPRKRRMPWS
jgi:hypothetical protein